MRSLSLRLSRTVTLASPLAHSLTATRMVLPISSSSSSLFQRVGHFSTEAQQQDHQEAAEQGWQCPECGKASFMSRAQCFFCNSPKPEQERLTMVVMPARRPQTSMVWRCPQCGAGCFPDTSSCFKCQTAKPAEDQIEWIQRVPRATAGGGERNQAGMMQGRGGSPSRQGGGGGGYNQEEWNCAQCGKNNFNSRLVCRQCGNARS